MWSLRPLLFLLPHLLLPHVRSSSSPLPFAPVWNAPTSACLARFGVDLDLGTFSVLHNRNQTFVGDQVAIFYSERLGLYPRYLGPRPLNGGVPQNASLEHHLRTAEGDIRETLPDRAFAGLAVVDWEAWRPVWERNWDAKRVYQEASRELTRSRHPDWTPEEVEAAARMEFQEAGRAFMEETLKLGRRERPGGLWGFYGFPNCYNYPGGDNYTGQCPKVELRRNDQLAWLWNASSALYPDIYLGLEMRGRSREVELYARHRVLEAARAAEAWQSQRGEATPVFPYARIVYTYSLDFLSQDHLVYTIGESASQGCAGVVLWGDNTFAKSKATCYAVKAYMDTTLGRYVVNVTAAALLCSHTLCSSHGRCQRRGGGGAMLHLHPARWKVVEDEQKPGGRKHYTVLEVEEEKRMRRGRGGGEEEEEKVMKEEFQCSCYSGWTGESCSQKR